MTDPIADFLTRIRNAVTADADNVLIPSSQFSKQLARVLTEEGYIEGWSTRMMKPTGRGKHKIRSEFEYIDVVLKYTEDREPVISGLKRISKPGRRDYVKATQLPRVLGGMGTAIVTTSSGVMTAYEAKRKQVGGEVVAFVW